MPYNPYGPGQYYTPGNPYGSPVDYSTAPIVNGPGGYLADNPQAAYLRFIAPFAGGNDAFSTFVRNQYSRAYGGFQAAAATNPSLNFGLNRDADYLNQLGPNFFRDMYSRATAQQRGISTPNFGAGRTQWQRQFL